MLTRPARAPKTPEELRHWRHFSTWAWYSLNYWTDAYDTPDFVYFVQEEDGGAVKIGRAFDPVKRLAQLQCGNPRRLKIRALLLGSPELEKGLHRLWRAAAVGGEWFGAGCEQAILTLAERSSQWQMEDHREGADGNVLVQQVLSDFTYRAAA